jgi:1-acylglycerone phosphate reductase
MDSASRRKTVLVTGCSVNSLGEALAKEFHRRNYHVIATARSLARLTPLKEMGMTTLELDLTSSASLKNLASQITKLDILVNNAGANLIMMFADTTPEDFRRMFEINVYPQFELSQLLLPHLVRSKGMIVNHTSQSCYGLKTPCCAYAAAKAALACMTDVIRVELQPFGIKVVEIVTGMAMSNMTDFEKQPPLTLPEGSLYFPLKEKFEQAASGNKASGRQMSAEKWAKRVVGDLEGGWFGTPKQIWRGAFATTMYWVYLIDVLWKGCLDGLFRAALGLSALNDKKRKKAT